MAEFFVRFQQRDYRLRQIFKVYVHGSFNNNCITLSQASGLLQGLIGRLRRSWNSKRGRNSTRYSYNSKADATWNIALQQLQSLLPAVKEAEEKCENHEGPEDGLQPNRDLQKVHNGKDSLNQHTSKPSTYIQEYMIEILGQTSSQSPLCDSEILSNFDFYFERLANQKNRCV